MEIFLHIKPTFDCVVKLKEITKDLQADKTYTFMVNSNLDTLNILVYPITQEKNNLPYICKIDKLENFLTTNCKNAEVITYPNNNYLVKLSPLYFATLKPFTQKVNSVNFGGQAHNISWLKNGQCLAIIDNKQNTNYLEITNENTITNLKTTTKNNLLFLTFTTNKNTYVFCIVKYENNLYTLINQYEADLIEENKENVKLYKDIKDSAGHGEVTTITLDNLQTVRELVYNNDEPFTTQNINLIPFAFFNAIKVKNYKLARFYMSKTLNEKLKDAHLKAFFNDFNEVTPTLSPTFSPNEIALIYQDNFNNKYAKIFNLDFDKENKITNIYEQ